MKLRPRLKRLLEMINSDYDHVWDTCCDHGLLGQALLIRQDAQIQEGLFHEGLFHEGLFHEEQNHKDEQDRVSQIHFVDIVPELMATLERRLRDHDQARWQVHCQDVTTLDLSVFPDSKRHLIIIAGVGGDLSTDIVRAVWSRLSCQQRVNVEFLLCPVYHQYQLRLDMKALGLKLESEQLVEDNRRCYELLHLSVKADQEITPVGHSMWDFSDASHLLYLRRTIEHYQKVSQGHSVAQTVCDAYLAIAPSEIRRR